MMIEKINIYDEFSCIAGACPLTCCQEWKISVDEDTFEDWKEIPADDKCLAEGNEVQGKALSDYVTYKDETRVIALNHEKKCPFLNKEKLCKLVISHGDSTLSETCQVFPRQNSIYGDREVRALMAGCPAVVDLIREQDKINVIREDGPCEDVYFDIRDILIQLMQREDLSIEEALQTGFIVLLNLLELPEDITDEELKEPISHYFEKEVQDDMLKEIHKMEFKKVYTFEECNELFLDLAENYRKEGIYEAYLLETAELAEEYEQAQEYEIEEDVTVFEEQYQKYEKLMRNYLVAEIFANLYLPEASLETVTMALEWIAMEYAAIRHTIFLRWVLSRQDEISYEIVRDAIVIISRMTGYDEEDIEEYLENSFEASIWEWGYLALITGKMN